MHFTHVDNLQSMLVDGAFYPDALVGERLTREVGDRDIKAARRRNAVTCEPGGCPADYVPFYFAPRSPMLYRIARGGVAHYQDGQTPLIYLVTTIADVGRSALRWVFSNGNCSAPTTEYFNDLRLLDTKIDWPLQDAVIWTSTPEDPNRATRRAAEFLVHGSVPWHVIRWVVARTTATATTAGDRLRQAGSSQQVFVRPRWYFNGRKYR